MSNTRTIISTVLILALLAAIAVLASGLMRQSRLDESSREFAISTTSILLSGNPRYQALEDSEDAPELEDPPTVAETFRDLAHPTLLARRSLEDLSKYFYTVTLNMGPLELVQSISGTSTAPLLIFNQQVPSASYELEVSFRAGTAVVDIEMLMENDEWLLSEFSVETSLLAD